MATGEDTEAADTAEAEVLAAAALAAAEQVAAGDKLHLQHINDVGQNSGTDRPYQ